MNFITLENNFFSAVIAMHGAELKSLQSKRSGRNYIYDGTGSWKRSAPVLFPNIGGLAEEVYLYNGKAYPAPAHGFVRDMDFTLVGYSPSSASFLLESSEKTAVYFPFSFTLCITYSLMENGIQVTWQVENKDNKPMYFSIGAHPGFSLLPETKLSDYILLFDTAVKMETRRVKGRYLTCEKEVLSASCNTFALSPAVLERDAIILEDTGLSKVSLVAPQHNYHLWITFPDFPVLAVWTDPHTVHDARFLCLEPWCGINDLCGAKKKDISQKERIIALAENTEFARSYVIGVEE